MSSTALRSIPKSMIDQVLISLLVPKGSTIYDLAPLITEEIEHVMVRAPFNRYRLVPLEIGPEELPTFNLVHLDEDFDGEVFDVWDLVVTIEPEDDEWGRLKVSL